MRSAGIHILKAPEMPPQPRRRGRPPSSKNKPPQPRRPGRPPGSRNKLKPVDAYLSKEEKDDLDLAIILRQEGKIVANGEPFEQSRMAEIDGLIANGTFKIVNRNDLDPKPEWIFGSRLVNKIKGKNAIPYEKSRLVVQGYNDAGKNGILTQAPTIQRASQRLLISLIQRY